MTNAAIRMLKKKHADSYHIRTLNSQNSQNERRNSVETQEDQLQSQPVSASMQQTQLKALYFDGSHIDKKRRKSSTMQDIETPAYRSSGL